MQLNVDFICTECLAEGEEVEAVEWFIKDKNKMLCEGHLQLFEENRLQIHKVSIKGVNLDLHFFSKMKELMKCDNFKIENKDLSALFDSVIL